MGSGSGQLDPVKCHETLFEWISLFCINHCAVGRTFKSIFLLSVTQRYTAIVWVFICVLTPEHDQINTSG